MAEIVAAIVLCVAAMAGGVTVVPGIQLRYLGYDNIAFAVVAVGLVSVVLATDLLFSLARSWGAMRVVGFVVASLLAWLSASAFENAQDLTINGASRHWISWPLICWLLLLWAGFVALALCRTRPAA